MLEGQRLIRGIIPDFNKLMVQQRGPTDHINGKHSPSPPYLLYLVFWVTVYHSKGTGVPSEYFSKESDLGNEQ